MSAAKQGLTAHISQASEDAKRMSIRALPTTLQRHPFLSNLNTTCTIKSAPPRTPECMTRLATKSGWLYKRNEQNKWQRRWCCVVPHTFLYYFDSEPAGDGNDDGYYGMDVRDGENYPTMINENAIYDDNSMMINRKNIDTSVSSTSVSSGWCAQDTPSAPISSPPTNSSRNTSSNTAPVGIIDLECYSNVNRDLIEIQPASSPNGSMHMMELAPDGKVNPDLRSFFFQADSLNDLLEWSKVFLYDRFHSVRDERDAYKVICDSFPMQLSNLNGIITETENDKKESESKIYQLRSANEESKRLLYDKIVNALESLGGNQLLKELSSRTNEAKHLNNASLLSGGVQEALDLLISHALLNKQEKAEMAGELQSMKEDISTGNTQANEEVDSIKQAMAQAKEQHMLQLKRSNERIFALEKLLEKARVESETNMRELEAKGMEFGIYKASSKSKLQELSQHKKILKNEVLELRKQLNNVTSQLNKEKLETEKVKLELDTQKERNKWKDEQLKNYTKNFDNLLETMSIGSFSQQYTNPNVPMASATTSSVTGRDPNRPPRPNSKRVEPDEVVVDNQAHDDDDDDDDSNSEYSEYSRGNMSELTTEDISHACLSTKASKHSASQASDPDTYNDTNHRSEAFLYGKARYGDPQSSELERIDSSPDMKHFRDETNSVGNILHHDAPISSDRSVHTSASMKLSVAQKARLQADQPTPARSVQLPKPKGLSVFDKLGDRVTSLIDNSPIGVKLENQSAPSSPVGPMSLKERERRQREGQLNFLRKEGILKENEDISVASGNGRASTSSIGS